MDFNDSFSSLRVDGDGVKIHLRHKGEGPPLLLIHGYPQTGYMWHKIADQLAASHHVIIPDIRGYGRSDKPPTDAAHSPYAKRAMAKDMMAVMAHFGYARFDVAGHDRGGRVAHRLARDYPDAVKRLAVLDIAPTAAMYAAADMDFGRAYYHWFFLIQPAPLPETLIGNNVEFFLRQKLAQWGRTNDAITEAAFAEYLACFSKPETIHASCEDYRAAASIDLDHDRADADKKLAMPVLALWGERGFVGQTYDVITEWQKVAEDVRGHGVPGGHFLAEESPAETLAALAAFFA
jgi:haloacetate dehalogenase